MFFSRVVAHTAALCRKCMVMYQWRNPVACCDNTIDRLLPTTLLNVRFSNWRESQDVLKVVFSFNFEIYMALEDSKDPFSMLIANLTYIIPVFKNQIGNCIVILASRL